MNSLKKIDPNKLALINSELAKYELDIHVGDKVMDDDGYVREIFEITTEKFQEWDDKLKKTIKVKKVVIKIGFYRTDEETGEKHKSEETVKIEDFKQEYIRLDRSVDQIEKEAVESLLIDEPKEEQPTASDDQSLVHFGSKETLILLKKDIEKKRQLIELKARTLKRVLDQKRHELSKILEEFEGKIEKIKKVIYTIELYLGIKEQVIEIQDGVRASMETPICFRQEVLYMDEEVGDPEDDGIDFKKIGDFDQWLLKNKNYKKLIPELKGVVILRVRREDKRYTKDNPFIDKMLNENNKETYILIRNGDRICRIWADIIIHPRLFPRRNEYQWLLDVIAGRTDQKENGDRIWDSDKKKYEDRLFRYKQQMIMLQGMIDRTELFQPLPPEIEIKLSNNECHEKGYVRYVYDDEIKLPDNRLPFEEWHTKINGTIKEGSRVIISGRYGDRFSSRRDYDHRFLGYRNEHNIPPLPDAGVYIVEKVKTKENGSIEIKIPKSEYDPQKSRSHSDILAMGTEKKKHEYRFIKELHGEDEGHVVIIKLDEKGYDVSGSWEKERLIIKYNPQDEVYGSWGNWDPHKRKNRLSFIIEQEDEFILNFDEVTLDDVEFYLNSRINRKDYLWMMPCLYEIKKMRLAEIEFEKDFVKMMAGQLYKTASNKKMSMESLEAKIWETVKWWKLKNKWKRAISKDDAKALRMIKKRIEKLITKQ